MLHLHSTTLSTLALPATDPEAALEWVVKYMGASPILQKRGAVADGACALLKWATWPLDGGHEWHLVDAMQVGRQTSYGLSAELLMRGLESLSLCCPAACPIGGLGDQGWLAADRAVQHE